MIKTYLNSINYFLDNQHHISDLEFLKNNQVKNEKYLASGGKYHYKTEKSSSELAYRVLYNFIEKYPSIKNELDFIIFTTDNLDNSNDINVITVNSILNELELTPFPILQGLSNCANSAACLTTACGLIESGRAKNILIISIDNVGEEDDNNYKMESEVSVLSDAAICIWVSSTPVKGALTVDKIFQINNPVQWLIDPKKDYQQYTTNKLKNCLSISKKINGAISGEINHFILNNYFIQINKVFIELFGIKKEIVENFNLERLGHAPAGDIFINLHDLMQKGKILDNENIVLFAESPSLSISIILKKDN